MEKFLVMSWLSHWTIFKVRLNASAVATHVSQTHAFLEFVKLLSLDLAELILSVIRWGLIFLVFSCFRGLFIFITFSCFLNLNVWERCCSSKSCGLFLRLLFNLVHFKNFNALIVVYTVIELVTFILLFFFFGILRLSSFIVKVRGWIRFVLLHIFFVIFSTLETPNRWTSVGRCITYRKLVRNMPL